MKKFSVLIALALLAVAGTGYAQGTQISTSQIRDGAVTNPKIATGISYTKVDFTGMPANTIPNTEVPLTFSSPLVRTGNTISLSTVPESNGGTGITALPLGLIPFGGASTYAYDTNLKWDASNHRLGIGKTPLTAIDVNGTVSATGFAGAFTGPVTGNADTATALAADPADCVNQFAIGITANGTATCTSLLQPVGLVPATTNFGLLYSDSSPQFTILSRSGTVGANIYSSLWIQKQAPSTADSYVNTIGIFSLAVPEIGAVSDLSNFWGGQFQASSKEAGITNAYFNGVSGEASITSGSSSQIFGGTFTGWFSGGTNANVTGLGIATFGYTGGSAVNLTGIDIISSITAPATSTNVVGIWQHAAIGGTNNVNVLIGTDISPTGNFSIFSNSDYPSKLSVTTDVVPLTINGTAGQTTNLLDFTVNDVVKTHIDKDGNFSGLASNLSGTPALPNGTTASTQSPGDNSTKVGTTAYTDAGLALKLPITNKYTWNNAAIVALGANLTGEITVATLPAKTVVKNAYVVINTAATGSATLTVALGYTGGSYVDYIVASDARAAANTVYGDTSGERGTALTGYDLPSFTGTTDLKLHFISTVNNLDQVLTSTGTVYIETEILP